MTLYLDTSVIVPLFVEERSSDQVSYRLENEHELLISAFAAAEFASALSLGLRTKRFDLGEVHTALAAFDEWRKAAVDLASIEEADFRQADQIVRRFDLQLRAPDALHLAASMRLDATLITLDDDLAHAAAAFGARCERP